MCFENKKKSEKKNLKATLEIKISETFVSSSLVRLISSTEKEKSVLNFLPEQW